ncbi:MAG: hypothetical protein JJT96_20675 [Opitutales bacterium]|nr:hypothetical protein [Opitutales bacterium]
MKKLFKSGSLLVLFVFLSSSLNAQSPSVIFTFDFSGSNPEQPTFVGSGWVVSALQLTGNGFAITNAGVELESSPFQNLVWDTNVDPINPNSTGFAEFSITNLTGVTQTLQWVDFLGSSPPWPDYTGNWEFYLDSDINPVSQFVASAVAIPPTVMPLQLYFPPWADYKVSHGETMTFNLRTTNSQAGGHEVFLEYLEIAAIPEPQTFAFIGGMIAL